jgi:APA family basic amino acid/polyamine antiporter
VNETTSAALPRRLGTGDAVVLGLASMLGAGVFTVFTPAVRTAGWWLPLAIVLAGVVAACNAFSTADLAANQPESGGGYVYGRRRLAPWAGRLAGVAFLVGKTASAAAAARVFAGYVLPTHPLWVAIPLILVVSVMNLAGVRWTARSAWVLVPGVLGVLGVVVVATLLGGRADTTDPTVTAPVDPAGIGMATPSADLVPVTPLGVLTAAGLIFFAFAGYARMATLGEEVRDPAHTLRRAIPLALGIALVAYLAVGVSLLLTLGPAELARSGSPLAAAVGAVEAPALGVVIRFGAAAASAAALLSVLVGLSRTTLAMARHHDLPHWLSAVGPRGTPWRADVLGALVAMLTAVLAGPVAAIALSACCVLVYYAVINCAALMLPSGSRRWPGWTSVLGLALCLLLAALLPTSQVLVSAVALVLGTLICTALAWRARRAGAADDL